MADADPAPRSAAKRPPFGGFRVLFALINGALWFALGGAVSLGASFGLEAADKLRPGPLAAAAATAAFFASFFGMPGALTGFLGLARDRRFALPPEEKWGEGRIAQIWLHGLIYAFMLAPAAYALIVFVLEEGTRGAVGRGRFCLLVAAVAAVAGAVQAFVIASPASLGDLRPSTYAPTRLSTAWLVRRAGLPQGFGNGAITALIALGSVASGPAGLAQVRMPLWGLVGDAGGTGLVVALFMTFSAGGLAAMDRQLGRVGPADVRPATPATKLLVSFVASAACAFLALVLGLASASTGLPPWLYVAWKGLLGAGVGALTAMRAAEWGIAATDGAKG